MILSESGGDPTRVSTALRLVSIPHPATTLNTDVNQMLPKANILLVDDNPANLLAFRAVLDELKGNLVEARTGEEALECVRKDEFAVVLLDINLPDRNGFEVAGLIREIRTANHVPIIFVTANEVDTAFLEQGYALGAVDFLIKPILPFVLRAKVAGFVDLFRDKQRAMRQADQFRLLIEGTKDYAIFLLDVRGFVASWNNGAERIKQYRADEIIGHHFSQFYPRDAIERNWPEHELEVARREGRFEDEGWRLRKDSSQFWASVVITALYGDDGEIRGFSKITRDMTEKKEAEAALRLANDELERRVTQRTLDLARANESLMEADRRKDEFLAMLAHELRNPLSPIRNSLQILQMKGIDAGTDQQIREMMNRQVNHLVRLVDDLMDVSRVMRGKIDLRREPVDLASLINRAIETATPLLELQGHELKLDLPCEPVVINVDPIRFSQILGNLLTNAAKYSDPHGVITLIARLDADELVIQIHDNGIGIEPDVLPHIFELFVQADHATTKAQGGLGIGLTLVKTLVEMHGGSVTAESEGLGCGTRIELRLPLSVRLVGQASVGRKQQTDRSSQLVHSLLVVDDNKDAADSLATLLRLQGHDVHVAYGGRAAIDACELHKPAMIFLDLGMPEMDGYEVARQIRSRPGHVDVLLTALTGWGQPEDRRRTTEAGFNRHLVKPVDPQTLVTLMTELDERRQEILSSFQ